MKGEQDGSRGGCRVGLVGSSELKAALFDATPDPVIVHTWDGIGVYCNRTATLVLGYTEHEFAALPAWAWVSDQARKRVGSRLKRLREKGAAEFPSGVLCKSGQVLPTEVTVRSMDVAGEQLLIAVVHLTEGRSESEQRVRHLAFHDRLTDVGNRTLFEERLSDALADADEFGASVGVVYLDLDDFKPVNDTYGHALGDEILKVAARRMEHSVREHIDVVARLGGDEFGILVVGLNSPEDLAAVGRNLQTVINQPVHIGDHCVQVSASVGLAVYRSGEAPDELLVRADHEMYRAKRDGIGGPDEFLKQLHAEAGASSRTLRPLPSTD